MTTYAVIISNNSDAAKKRIEEQYDKADYYETPDGYFFINDAGLTDEVAKKVGLVPSDEERESGPVGLIFKYERVDGWYYKSLWEWLEKVKKES